MIIVAAECSALPSKPRQTQEVVAAARQQGPINAALTGFFSPPFVVLMSMSALFYTFEKFAKDMMKEVSKNRGMLLRRKKKKPTPAPAQPLPQTSSRDIEREHRKLIEALEKQWI
ncbi:hypothetical protein CDAR_203491 [Caerostris darwini]|uniref:Uncharacterized protein n=1 Tax=Caerostris darwini TaxID=1538125 RepID=A0AAV4Q5P4_9ARAC|nr:hypothetical protein CDAR_203221 [Caerostris darwini]GIY05337.1 hypothetical protein CDAR_203491 [Caerostris darwini]